ncbi:hypothetical protein NEIG_00828 [Nematocida sp. ERTm5]|nr:hypothetical protein NEIG_00828 [Nematocida sp. ERTm5]
MNSNKKERAQGSRRMKSNLEKKKAVLFDQNTSSLCDSQQNSPLLNQMKTEIRRLYGEKVNMVNTNYIMKPHEFKCIAKALSKRLWNEEKPLQTIDEIIYAVDLLCNRQDAEQKEKEAKEAAQEKASNRKEVETTIRFITAELNALVPSEESATASAVPGEPSVSACLPFLMAAKDRIKKELESSGYSTVESLITEKNRLKRIITSITETFSISPSDEILTALKGIRILEEKKQKDYIQLREKNFECQKRHFDETIRQATDKISLLESQNKELNRLLQEREDKTAEVLERGDALQQNILQIKKILADEELRIQQEREEYKTVKSTLIGYNKKMTKIVQELIERIKKEQKERDNLLKLTEASTK